MNLVSSPSVKRPTNRTCQTHDRRHRIYATEKERPLVIQPKPATRQAAEPPKPVQIERSSSFLIRRRDQDKGLEKVRHKDDVVENFNDNPIEWVLKKTDESLDAVEERVPDAARSAITYVTGTFGTNTSKYAVDAMKLAGKGGSKVLEVAVPASKWAISKGVGILMKSVTQKKDSDKKTDSP